MKKKDPTSHRIIEKRRRDRMNNCLADLSKLIPAHYMKKGHGRVEKTEIIEMAIKHLKDLIKLSTLGDDRQRVESRPDSIEASEPAAGCLYSPAEQLHSGRLRTAMAPGLMLPMDCSMGERSLQTSLVSCADEDEHQHDSVALMRRKDHPPSGPSPNSSSSSSSLSTKEFHYQQYHNNERQIIERANEQKLGAAATCASSASQSNKYRPGECCTCRARVTPRIDGGKSHVSSSDQSDTGSLDYSSSSSGNKSDQKSSPASCAESAAEAKYSPASSVSSHSSACSSHSASSNSTGWYKKAWLVRSISRSIADS